MPMYLGSSIRKLSAIFLYGSDQLLENSDLDPNDDETVSRVVDYSPESPPDE